MDRGQDIVQLVGFGRIDHVKIDGQASELVTVSNGSGALSDAVLVRPTNPQMVDVDAFYIRHQKRRQAVLGVYPQLNFESIECAR